jgi:integrase
MSRSQRNPIYERIPGSGVYTIRYADSEHKIRRETVSWRSLKEAGIVIKGSTRLARPGRELAQRLLNARRAACDKGQRIAALHTRRVTFSELCDTAIVHVGIHNRGSKIDKSRIGRLKEKFGHYSADSIPLAEITAWLANADWSPATRNRYRASLSLIFRLAIKDRKAKENPARLLEHHKESRGRIRFLNQRSPLPTDLDYLKNCTDEESRLRAVIAKNHAWHTEEFLVALNCGLRPSEMYDLTWDRVDFIRKQIFIERSKSGQSRHVPLNSEALSALKRLYARPVRKQQVFLAQDGRAMIGNRYWFPAAVAEGGLADFSWYCLRHTFASRLIMAGVDIRTVAELMGHSGIQMTMRYAHLGAKHTHAAVDRLITTDFSGHADTDTSTDTKPPEAGKAEGTTVTLQ